jgi:hypothetical protein
LVTTHEALVVGATLVGVFQVYVSLRLLFSHQYTISQTVWQLLLVWLIPFFGAMVVFLFMESDLTPPPKRDTAFTQAPGGNPEGIGSGSDHA